MTWPMEVAAVVQGRRQMWLMITLGAAPKRRMKNGISWTSIRWSTGEVVCWLSLHRLVKMAAVWRRHHPYHLGNRLPWCHPLDHRRSCHPLQQPRSRHSMLQVGCECASDWAAVREKYCSPRCWFVLGLVRQVFCRHELTGARFVMNVVVGRLSLPSGEAPG